MTHVNLLVLTWDIMVDDADDGRCYAGEGKRVLSAHKDVTTAKEIAALFNPIVRGAEKETIVFPVQHFNKLLKSNFGFTTSDIDQTGENFKFSVETFELLP